MKPLIAATEFAICVSMSDVVIWPDESSDITEPSPRLQAVFELLGVNINLVSLHHDYFHNRFRAGSGNIHIYERNEDPNTVIAIDLYNEPTDQMDLIHIYIRCNKSITEKVAILASYFFNSASTQVMLSQQCISKNLRDAIDRTRFPLFIEKSRFPQIQIHHN
jgi:hypothetical protein